MEVKKHISKRFFSYCVIVAILFNLSCWWDSPREKARKLNNKAVNYEEAGRLDKAIATYKKALKVDPSYRLAAKNLRIACTKKWRKEQALNQKIGLLSSIFAPIRILRWIALYARVQDKTDYKKEFIKECECID